MSKHKSSVYVNSSWKEVPESTEILEQYILTIKEIEDEGEQPQIDQELIFSIDIDDFDDDKIDEIEDELDVIQEIAKSSKCFLPIINYRENDQNYLKVICQMPYTQLISTYYKQNEINETELKMHCADLVEIYKTLGEHKELELELSVNDMSLVLYRDDQSPVARICVTPYAFIKTLLNKFEGKKARKYKPFEKIFEFFDNEAVKYNNGKKQFTKIIETLSTNKDAMDLIKINSFLNSCKDERKIPEFRVSDLKVEQLLGSGTYGAVLKVRSNVNNSLYALKVSNCYSSDSLMKESFTLYALKHRNIVQFFGFCLDKANLLAKAQIIEENEYKRKQKINAVKEIIQDNGKNKFSYMKMEFCGFGDLESYVKKHYSLQKPMPVKEMEIIFGQLLQAIFHVHDKRLAHRDLKPENVLIKQTEPFVWIKLCDFGCARVTDSMMVSLYVGTPITNHPDVASGNYSSATELYSLGIIMYIVLYSQHPFQECKNENQIIAKTRKGIFDFPELTEKHKPFIDLTKELMALGTKNLGLTSKGKQNFETYWDNYKNHPFCKTCMKAADKAFEKHVPLMRQTK